MPDKRNIQPPPASAPHRQWFTLIAVSLLSMALLLVFAPLDRLQQALLLGLLMGLLPGAVIWLWHKGRFHTPTPSADGNLADTDMHFKLMVDAVRDYAILMLDEHGMVKSWNAGAERIKGYRSSEILGQHFSRFYTSEDIAAGVPARALAEALITGQYSEDGWRVRKDGSRFRASVLITAMRDPQGRIRGFAKVTRDISARQQHEERMRLAATVFNSTQEGVAITDPQGNVVSVNPAFMAITEYKEHEVIGKNLRMLASGRHDRSYFQTLWRDIKTAGHWQAEIWNRRKSGDIYPGWLTISSVRDPDQGIVNYVAVFTDITRIRHSETQMEHLAHHDALTDLPNRLLLHSRLEHTLERAHRTQSLCAVLFLDLDRFKAVNDQYGHHSGDELLKSAAQRLRLNLRENDTVARLGGDEFIIVLEDLSSPESAAVVAQAIVDRMQTPFMLQDRHEAQIGCSVGISLFPQDGTDADTLIRHADTALYRAKEAGRCTYRFYPKPEA